jgi:hypothetical protein
MACAHSYTSEATRNAIRATMIIATNTTANHPREQHDRRLRGSTSRHVTRERLGTAHLFAGGVLGAVQPRDRKAEAAKPSLRRAVVASGEQRLRPR